MSEAEHVTPSPRGIDSPAPGRVSSPASTGGVGTFFEQHVVAYWLAQLLVRAIPPILLDCTIEEVSVQTEGLGWQTDDFLIVGTVGSGEHRRLAGQVKRSFTVSAADAECRKAFQDFWSDFRNAAPFSRDTDRLVLVTERGSNTLLEFFGGLLDTARAARDAAEFERRLTTPGLLNAKAIRYGEEIRAIIGEVEGREISCAELWPLLRVLHVLSLDLNTSTRQTEAAMKTLLAHTAEEHGAVAAADATWNALLAELGEGMPEARRYRLADLPQTLRSRHTPVAGPEHGALRALAAHSAPVLERIRTTIGPTLHLRRAAQMQKVLEGLQAQRIVMISGAAGSGKSSVAKDVIGSLAADHYVFSFRAEEFARAHLDETLVHGQIPASTSKLGAILASQPRKVLLVESVERLLEASTRDAFGDLLTLVSKDPTWNLILTCRDYSVDLVRDGLLAPAELGCLVVVVPPLDDDELREVEAAHAALAYPLANSSLRRLLSDDPRLVLGLVEDWAKGVSPGTPYPEGAQDAAAIVYELLPHLDRHNHEAFRKRVLGIVAKIPNAAPDAFTALLSGDGKRSGDRDLRKIVLEGLGGAPAARDMPEALASAAKGYIMRSGGDARRGSGLDEVETAFGIRSGRRYDYSPPSAYHGPFLPLLKHHPALGLAFAIDVLNQSADNYARACASGGSLEPLFEITLTFSDGTSKTQWCNGQLWLLYRGTSGGPYVLQSVLMALERLLLEVGEAQPGALDAILLSILRRSDSAALTAVMASLATAYPRWCAETLLVLLGCRACIQLDRSRRSQEIQAPSRTSWLFPSHDAEEEMYRTERTEADKLPHRERDLEAAVLELQLRGFGPRVQKVLDQHRTALAPLGAQTERDRIWRLALHRMDLRLHHATTVNAPKPSVEGSHAEDEAKGDRGSYVRLDLDVPESDLREMMTASASDLQRMEARAGLLMWATKVFEGEQGGYDPAHWPVRLKEAQAVPSGAASDDEFGWGRGGPQMVAAVCVRDHWDQMSPDEREWCVATVCAEVGFVPRAAEIGWRQTTDYAASFEASTDVELSVAS